MTKLHANKRDFIIEKQIVLHFVKYTTCLSNPLRRPFYATQTIKPYLMQSLKTGGISVNGEIVIPLTVFLV